MAAANVRKMIALNHAHHHLKPCHGMLAVSDFFGASTLPFCFAMYCCQRVLEKATSAAVTSMVILGQLKGFVKN